jgi:hypothetical protein
VSNRLADVTWRVHYRGPRSAAALKANWRILRSEKPADLSVQPRLRTGNPENPLLETTGSRLTPANVEGSPISGSAAAERLVEREEWRQEAFGSLACPTSKASLTRS